MRETRETALLLAGVHAYSYIQQSGRSVKKSSIHENADANITCDFGDDDISRFRSRLPHTYGAKTIKKNTNSTPNKSQNHRARQYEVTSFLSTNCELSQRIYSVTIGSLYILWLSTETCSKNVYSLGPWPPPPPSVILAGDFNLPDINWVNIMCSTNSQTAAKRNKLIEIIWEFGLTNMVNEPTRLYYGNILDLVLTSNSSLISTINTVTDMSDHEAILFDIDMNPTRKKTPHKVQLQICQLGIPLKSNCTEVTKH